jgi:oligopeptide/dipeptide ABC transporter ATP-binding protein
MVKNQEDNLLSVKDLVVEYTSDKRVVHAVNGVSFDVRRGQTLGLVGETGAGKTTIAKSILRILPDPPARTKSGQIVFEGKDILKCNNAKMRSIRGSKISMIFQDPMTALDPVMRVGDQITEIILLHNKVDRRAAEKKAIEMMKMVNIPEDRFREYPHQFSGGMKQRVVIAIALACNPDLLLADEPTTALDVTIQAQVLDLIQNLKRVKNTAMILITHDLGIIAGTCDIVAMVYAGHIIEYGTREQIFDHPTHPYTIGLFKALPDINSYTDRLNPINGMPPDPSHLPDGCTFHPRCSFATAECCKNRIEMVNIKGEGHLCRCCNIDTIISSKGDKNGIAC